MVFIFWLCLGLLFYVYLGYLIICVIIGKLYQRPLMKKEYFPSVSLIIPAFNEEKVIKQKIENTLSLDYPKDKLEIVVASESNDQTNSIVTGYLKKGIFLHSYRSRQGKSKTLFDTVPKTKGEIIVFSDANAIYAKDALKKLVRNFYDKSIGAVLGKLVVANPGDSSISEGESLYKKYEAILRKYNSFLHSVLGADGSMFAIRRQLYSPISPQRGDDFELALRVLIHGYGVTFEPEAISYENAASSFQDEIKRKIRIVSWFLKSSFILLKEMLKPFRGWQILQLVSNKILRWLSPIFLLVLFFVNIVLYRDKTTCFYSIFLFMQIIFYAVAVFGGIYFGVTKKKPPCFLGIPFYFLTFNFAFLAGILQGLFFKQAALWEKVR